MNIEDFGTDNGKDKKGYREDDSNKEIVNTAPTAGRPSEKINSFDVSQWSVGGNNTFRPTSQTIDKLPNGFYDIMLDNYDEPIFEIKSLLTDDLLILDDMSNEIVKEISIFWDKKSDFKKYGFCHRRGYLFYGKAGTGKSCIIKQVLQQVISNGGISISCNNYPENILKGIKRLRSIEPDRKLFCVFEDIDAIIKRYGEEKILSLLDGEDLTDNVLNIATTNYPEVLDKRIVARPRRFDRVIKIECPNADVRRKYFQQKLGLTEDEIKDYVNNSEGFTFAGLSDLVISTKCFDMDLNEAVKRLKELDKNKNSSEYYRKRVGFEE